MESPEKEEPDESKFPRPKEWIQQRYFVAIMGALSIMIQYVLKSNLSVGIVAMVKPLVPSHSNESALLAMEKDDSMDGEFSWDMETQGYVLSAYFYGYLATQFFGGYAANRWGGKIVVGPGVALTGLFTLFSPLAARIGGPWAFFAVRLIEGACSGVILPGMHYMFSVWFPPQERNAFSGAIFSAIYGGTVVGVAASGPLSKWPLEGGGWPMVFYFLGAIGVAFIIPWWFLVYDNPDTHPRISDKERNYIRGGLGREKDRMNNLREAPIPWLSILTDVPLWTGIIFHWSTGWVFYTMLAELPTYMKNVFQFDIQKVAFLSSLPSLLTWIVSVSSGILSQWLRKKNYISHLSAYKIFNGLAGLGMAACLIGVTQVKHDANTAVILLALSGLACGFFLGGSYVNHLDLAINYAGVTSGILHTVINTPGIIVPPVVAAIVEGKQTQSQWAIVFYMAAGISAGAYILYFLFGSVEERPWNTAYQNWKTEERKGQELQDKRHGIP